MTPQTFKQALSWLKPAITTSRWAMPILSHVLIQSNGKFIMTATDLSLGVRVTLPAEGPEFDLAVPFKPLFDISRVGLDQEIAFSEIPNAEPYAQYQIRPFPFALDSGTYHAELPAEDAGDYPVWPDEDEHCETRWASVADVLAALPPDLGGNRFRDRWNLRGFAAALKRLPKRPVELRITEKTIIVQSWEIQICQRIDGLPERFHDWFMARLPEGNFFDLDN